MEFHDELLQLGMITGHEVISRELWLRSKHSRWRFFRFTEKSLIELGRDGKSLAEKSAAEM